MQGGRFVKSPSPAFILGLSYIVASTPGHWRVDIIDESLDKLPPLSCYDIVGVSTTTRTALRAYRIAEEARAEDCYTMAGGIHATMRTDESLRFFDTVIAGEGEYPLEAIPPGFRKGCSKSHVPVCLLIPSSIYSVRIAILAHSGLL
ncbi:MAG: hypothetical protein E4H15_08850 [Syntrophobacterales bacterium]|nr:MAG: hypothetical protein E4H15_08850 [Syntrophobacterales bacterium]